MVDANAVELEPQCLSVVDRLLRGPRTVRAAIGDDDDNLAGLFERIGLLQHPPD